MAPIALTTAVAAAICSYFIRQKAPALLLSLLISLGLLIFFDLGASVSLLLFYSAVSVITAAVIHSSRQRARMTLGWIWPPRPGHPNSEGVPAQITKMAVATLPGALALGLGLFANFDDPPGNFVIVALSLLAVVAAALCAYFFRQPYVVIPLAAVGVLVIAFITQPTNSPLSIDRTRWVFSLLLAGAVYLAANAIMTSRAG